MPDKHPYISGSSSIIKAINHLRNSLPTTIDASTLKKLGLAKNNESYLISILKFIGIVGEDGSSTNEAKQVFSQHDDASFTKSFEKLVKEAYSELFALHSDRAWSLDQNTLITYFRQTDQSSAVVGSRQANTFTTLASLAGHGELSTVRRRVISRQSKGEKKAPKAKQVAKEVASSPRVTPNKGKNKEFGLSVRIEINLPVADDQETYDRIFKSLRENLLDG